MVSAIAPRPATVRRETGTRRRGDCGDGVEGGIVAPVCCSTAVGRPGRRLIPSVDDFAGQGINAAAARHTDNQHRNASRAGTGDTMNPIDDDELRELLPSLRRFALWLARDPADADDLVQAVMEQIGRAEEHTSELQSLMRLSYAVFCLKKQQKSIQIITYQTDYKKQNNKL